MSIDSYGTSGKIHQTCKFWTEKKCRNSSDSCRYLHTYHCPDGEWCRRKFCPLLHIRIDSKETVMMTTKTVIENSAIKNKNDSGNKRRQMTDLPQSSESSVFETTSYSPDWNCSSVAFEDFDEELCQGLEEVGQELDRFEEEVSESSQCEDEVIWYPSDHSSQDTFLSHKHPLKSEVYSEDSSKSNRSTRNMVSSDLSPTRRLIQGKQTEVFDQPSKSLQSETCLKNIPVMNSQYQREKKIKHQNPSVLIDCKEKNVPLINIKSTATVDSNYLNKDRTMSSQVACNWPDEDNKKYGFVDQKHYANKTMNLENFCKSSVNAKDRDCRFSMDSLLNLVAKIQEKSNDNENVTLMPSESGTRKSCHCNGIISLQNVDSSYVSTHLKDTSGNSALDAFENDDREEGELCEDDEMKELMSLVSQKQQLVHKVKMLIMQKKNLSLQRDSIMDGFNGDTAKLTKILNENSCLLKELSTYILKLNAQIKFLSRKIDILENNKSFTKTTEKLGYHNNKQVNASGCSLLTQKKLTLTILELLENMANKKKPLHERTKDESNDKLEKSAAKTDCRIYHESLTEQPASILNSHLLCDDKIRGMCTDKKKHLPEQVEKLEMKSVNRDPEENGDVCLGTTDISAQKENDSIEKGIGSLGHPNLEESQLVRISENKSSRLNKRSLMQIQYPHSVQKNDIQNAVKTPKGDLCKESEKISVSKGKMLNSSKDMNTHWCQPCNVFFTHVYGYVKHLESSKHMEKIKDDDTEKWIRKLPRDDRERQLEGSGGNQETVGVEFLHSAKAFFCELCECIIWNTGEAVTHPQSPLHVQKYKEHVLINTNQEMDFLQAKMAAFTKYCKERIARSKGTAKKEPKETNGTTENFHKTPEVCSNEVKCMNDVDVIYLGDREGKRKKLDNPSENKRKLISYEKDRKKIKLASKEIKVSEKTGKVSEKSNKSGWKTEFPSDVKNTQGQSDNRLSPAEVWTKALPSVHLREKPHSL
ncbi:uncharacterized protein [Panulirus ornatus]|uniref:uncharacterized protein n=1 Tax=Panulirus ornatus TaxID=150431 RepID=UPI003A861211